MKESPSRLGWAFQGNLKWPFELSRQGGKVADVSPSALEPETIDKVLRIVTERLAIRHQSLLSLEQDESDFLPSSFLEVATQRSMAVCRIVRYFSLNSFIASVEELIGDAEAIAGELRRLDPSVDSLQADGRTQYLLEILKEIFAIPEEVAGEIFNTVPSQQSENFQLEGLLKALLEKLQNISASQLSKFSPIALGTGFLVGGSHLMTNHHVVSTVEEAKECIAQFNYVQDALGGARTIIEYELDPDLLFVSNPLLDYTLVQLKAGMLKKQPGYTLGWIQLTEDDENILPAINSEAIEALQTEVPNIQNPFKNSALNPKGKVKGLTGDRVFIIQHPRGERQKIAQSDNKVLSYSDPIFVGGLLKNYVRYTTASDYGSSGAPVLNNQGELVALNHAVIYPTGSSKREFIFQGVRICRIVEDLKRRSFHDSKLLSFIQSFVVTSEQLNYPPLPSGLEFNGTYSYISVDSSVALASIIDSNELGSSIKLWNQNGVELRVFECLSPKGMTFSPNGKILAVIVDNGNTIQLWDVEDGNLLAQLNNPTDSLIESIAFNQDARILVSAGFSTNSLNGSIRFWNLENSTLLESPESLTGCRVSFKPGSSMLAVASNNGTVMLWDVQCKEDDTLQISLLSTSEGIGFTDGEIKFTPDGNIFTLYCDQQVLEIWIVEENGQLSKLLPALDIGGQFDFFLKNKILISADSMAIRFWSLQGQASDQEQRLLKTISLQNPFTGEPIRTPQTACFSKDGHSIAYIDFDNTIQVWGAEDGVLISSFNHFDNINSVNSGSSNSISNIFHAQSEFCPSIINRKSVSNASQGITIEAWVNPYPDNGTIISNSLGLRRDLFEWSLAVRYSTASPNFVELHVQLSGWRGSSNWKVASLAIGEWSHIAFVGEIQNSLNDNHLISQFYINGEAISWASENILMATGSALPPFCLDVDLIGVSSYSYQRDPSGSGLNNFFNGVIAEIRVWKTAHSQDQIKVNMRRRVAGNEEGLTDYWRFEEGEGTKLLKLQSVTDYSLLHGGKWLNATQLPALSLPFGLRFDRENDQVTVDCAADKALNAITESITVEAWIKHKYGNCLIVSRCDNAGQGYILGWHEQKIRVSMQSASSSTRIIIDTRENAPSDCNWHHVAFSWDCKSQEIVTYIDGKLQESFIVQGQSKSTVHEGQHRNIGLFAGPVGNFEANLVIGCRHKEEDNYDIAIAEVRLWRVPRSQNQVKVGMARRLKGNENGLIAYWRLDDGDKNNRVARNLVADKSSGNIQGATWFPK